MKLLKKALSVGLSLVMCAGMVAPAFAASFGQLQDAINYGTAAEGIEVTDGADSRTITILQDVKQEEGEIYLAVAGESSNVTLNLNGYSIIGNGTSNVMVVADNAQLTVNGADENGQKGSITGGNGDYGAGMNIWWNSTVTLNDVNVTNNTANYGGGGLYVENSSVTLNNVEVSGNEAGFAGGIEAYSNATVEINGGKIASNTAAGNGGGIIVEVGSSATIKNVEVTGNECGGGGAGVDVYDNANVEISNSNIHHNTSTCTTATGYGGGGIAIEKASLTVTDSHVDDNVAQYNGGGINAYQDSTVNIINSTVNRNEAKEFFGGGIYAQDADITISASTVEKNSAQYGGGVFGTDAKTDIKVVNGSKVDNNSAGERGDDFYGQNGTKLTLPEADSMNLVLEQDGKQITGWYYDSKNETANYRWGNFYLEEGTVYDGSVAFALKAAHDQYFDVVYTDGVNGTLFHDQTHEVENKNPIPAFNGEIPERPGFTFNGWLVDDESFDPETGTVNGALTLVASWIENPAPVEPAEPDPGIEIDDPAVPLAGLFTRADAIGYLWEQTGSPEAELSDFPDVPEDHEWAVAIGWAQDMGIALADQDGNFRPDDLVLRSVESLDVSPEGELQEFLDRYAVFAGIELAEGEHFYELDGAFDDVIMGEDAQIIFDEFFTRLEAALAAAA